MEPLHELALPTNQQEELALLPDGMIGPFQVVRLLGCGRISEAWFAVDTEQPREVVLKVLRKPWASDAIAVRHMHNHLSNLATVKHPNLAQVLDVRSDEDVLYWVTEWVKGGSVGPRVRRKGPLSPAEALTVIDQAAAGLAHCAASGLLHGGLKAENVLLERSGVARIADVGIEMIARRMVSAAPGSEKLWETAYMSPEVKKHHTPDLRSDIYSLGCILSFLLTGIPPQKGLLETAAHQRLPAPVCALLNRMVAVNPAHRIENYGDLRAVIAELDVDHVAPLPAPAKTHDTPPPIAPAGASSSALAASPAPVIDPATPPAGATPVAAAAFPAAAGLDAIPSDMAPANPQPLPAESAPASRTVDVELSERRLAAMDKPAGRPAFSPATRNLLIGIALGLAAGSVVFFYSRRDSPVASPGPVPEQNLAAAVLPLPDSPAAQPAAAPPVPAAPAATAVAMPPPPPPAAPATAPAVQSASEFDLAAIPAADAPPDPVPTMGLPAIVADNNDPESLKVSPSELWRPSAESRASYANSSMVAPVSGPVKTASFSMQVPAAGRYQLYLWWISRSSDVRSEAVPAIVHTSDGDRLVRLDQVNTESDFNYIGTFRFAGGLQRVVSITSERVPNESGNVYISVDAAKLVRVGD